MCWACGQAGTGTIDHRIPRFHRRTKLDVNNWDPAYGVNGCPRTT
ncbi:hypothetical protein [Plantactinospora sp. BB1]|nr:hypothetical protein [Plantactinospora sp. BB1]